MVEKTGNMVEKTEGRIQYEIYSWFNNKYCLKMHNPRCSIFSVPNELLGTVLGVLKSEGISQKIINRIRYKLASKFKATGLKSGVSDLIVLLPNKTLFVEVKTPTGSMSKTQMEFCDVVDNLGFKYYLVRSLVQFKEIIESEINNQP